MPPDELSRRDFAAALALLAAAPLHADDAKPSAEQADLLLALVKARFGKHLDDRQLDALAKRLASLPATGKRLHGVPLANGDDPVTAFSADLP